MSKRAKAWVIIGAVVIVLGGVLFWGISRENERAEAQEQILTSSCIRDVSRKLYGLTSSSTVEIVDVGFDSTSSTVSGTFRDTVSSGDPLYTFTCNGLNTVTYERAQGN